MQRRVGDSFSWKVPLDTTNVTAGAPAFVIEDSSFSIRHAKGWWRQASAVRARYEISATTFQSATLRYKYVLSDVSISKNNDREFWYGFIAPRLENLTGIELLKQPEDERPIELGNTEAYFYAADIVKNNTPTGWKFWDDYIPRWRQVFQQTRV
jgi:hypothetical protein